MAGMTFPSADKERRDESEYAVSSKENEHVKIPYKKLLSACEDGKVEIVRALLHTGCNANGISEGKEIHVSKTPLMHAATRGHCDIVDCLLKFGAKIDLVESNTGRTALHYASAGGHLKVVEILLYREGNIQKGDRYLSTPLKLAIDGGHETVASLLMKRGADVTVTDRCGQTALHFASKNGQVQLVKRLISCGVQIDTENKYHRTPLMLSIIYKHFDVAHLLISSGASVKCLNQLDVDIGRQALTFAVMNNHLEMVRILISNGVGIKGKLNTTPPITALMWAAQNGNDMFVKQLILSGVDIDYQDEKAWTALHYAAYNDRIQCGILLAEAGADLESLNEDLLTPIKMASKDFQEAVLYTTSFNAKKAICVIGNASSGKSTLITALQNEKAPYLTQWYNWTFGVKKIQQRTAGIEPVEVKSERYGHVIFFDFAGQHEYHGPHEMFLESILNKSRSSVTIIVVVKVTEEESVILEQLDRWLTPVSKISTAENAVRVVPVASFMDKVWFHSKTQTKQKVQRAYERAKRNFNDASLDFKDICYVNCRQPYSPEVEKLCSYLSDVPVQHFKVGDAAYSICWVIYRIRTTLKKKAIQLSEFTQWIAYHKADLPTNLPSPVEVCEDLCATGHFLYLPNKEDSSSGWLILDLSSILHEVYGTLFSTPEAVDNIFGLLDCQKLPLLFPELAERMVRDLLISLEFCIEVDQFSLIEENGEHTKYGKGDHKHLYFPALVSSKPLDLFTDSKANLKEDCHQLSWQLRVDGMPIISPRLLQTIILRLAGSHIFHHSKATASEHCCRIWCNGIFWQSNNDVDVAVQISDNTVVQVIAKGEYEWEHLCAYVSTVTQRIISTINELSPMLSATTYIIHPASSPQTLLENPRYPSPEQTFPVSGVLKSIRNRSKSCLSLSRDPKPATRIAITDLFCGLSPNEEDMKLLQFQDESGSPSLTLETVSPTIGVKKMNVFEFTTHDLHTQANCTACTPKASNLQTKPILNEVNKLLIRHIAPDWYSIGLNLDIEVSVLKIIEADIHPPSVEKCCREMFGRWLIHNEGTGGEPRIWRTVLRAVKNAGYQTLVGDIEKTFVQSAAE